MKLPSPALWIALALLPLAAAAEPVFHVSKLHEASGYPFSEAVEVDGWLILSGAIGTRPDTNELVEGGLEAEARAALDIVKATVEKHGYTLREVVKCTVMIEDMADWPLFNRIYMEYFSAPYPARSAFGADGLALGAAVEIECMARH
ncbi:MAG TPA: RidA family protein [Pseudomonadales bacterium]|nr:RidA family protein [Pseudomonadales bacterium]